uniref:Uncharacterized protein n=1 Tax=Arundo donax TaxID=35708 RepID=A0A0A9C8B7_ARUDO
MRSCGPSASGCAPGWSRCESGTARRWCEPSWAPRPSG